GAEISVVAFSPSFATDRLILVGTPERGIFRSTDGGNSWSPANAGLDNLSVADIVFAPDFSTTRGILAATAGGIYRSTDAGIHWSRSDNGLSMVTRLAFSPAYSRDRTVFATTQFSGLYKSTDGGWTWSAPGQAGGLGSLNTVVVSPRYEVDNTLFVGGENPTGLRKSMDGGYSWVNVSPFAGASVRALALAPDWPAGPMYAGTHAGVYISRSAGVSWQNISDSAWQGVSTGALSFAPNYPANPVLLVGTRGLGIWQYQPGSSISSPTPTATRTPTATASPTPTLTASPTATATQPAVPTPTATATATATSSPAPSLPPRAWLPIVERSE
ncbi:MAG: WD40/YVTN/BNR-like repeat-containing protein, partial [Anaerolineae bacterium]